MNRDDIINMAQEAGLGAILEEHAHEYGNGTFENTPYPALDRFAALVAAAERDAILQMSNEQWFKTQADFETAIRARGQA